MKMGGDGIVGRMPIASTEIANRYVCKQSQYPQDAMIPNGTCLNWQRSGTDRKMHIEHNKTCLSWPAIRKRAHGGRPTALQGSPACLQRGRLTTLHSPVNPLKQRATGFGAPHPPPPPARWVSTGLSQHVTSAIGHEHNPELRFGFAGKRPELCRSPSTPPVLCPTMALLKGQGGVAWGQRPQSLLVEDHFQVPRAKEGGTCTKPCGKPG